MEYGGIKPKLITALNRAAFWLSTPERLDVRFGSYRIWFSGSLHIPGVSEPPGHEELMHRLPVYWSTAAIDHDHRVMLIERAYREIATRANGPGSPKPNIWTPFCYFRLMNIPESEYLPGEEKGTS
jgi:hypothetical protein